MAAKPKPVRKIVFKFNPSGISDDTAWVDAMDYTATECKRTPQKKCYTFSA